jgi:hypothetical protein
MPWFLAAPLLESAHAALEARVDVFEAWLAFCTALVALGLLYEYGYDLHAFKNSRFRWAARLTHLGAILVTVGVAGELYIEVVSSRAQEDLRGFNNGAVAELNKTASDASALANAFEGQIADANARAKIAEGHIASANAASKDAIARVAVAESRVAGAEATARGFESQIAEAKARTAQAELELARIKQPRSLSPEQQQRIADALRKLPKYDFAFLVFGDPESLGLLADLDAALRRAQWSRVDTPAGLGGDIAYKTAGGVVPSINDVGLKAFVAADDTDGVPIVLALANAISSQGIICEPHYSEILRGHMPRLVLISIGQKRL